MGSVVVMVGVSVGLHLMESGEYRVTMMMSVEMMVVSDVKLEVWQARSSSKEHFDVWLMMMIVVVVMVVEGDVRKGNVVEVDLMMSGVDFVELELVAERTVVGVAVLQPDS